jgi:flavin reductase (DIM6/NTAB) family NADH-FMN oxidoreductase RutF
MFLKKTDIEHLEARYRATMINSLAGYKTAFLIGTKSLASVSNLGTFNSLIHIGADPALYGFICRPETVKRDTLTNILETGFYSFNFIQSIDYQKVHQCSAKYDKDISEFEMVGFEEEYYEDFFAPFVKGAVVKIGLKYIEKIDIKINGTSLIIGAIENLQFKDELITEDGFVAIEKENTLACVGLDAYYKAELIDRLPYARPFKI